MGHLNVPFGVRRVTTRTMPSFPAWVSVMTPVGHWNGVMLSSLNRTRSPICRLEMSFAIVYAVEGSGGSRMTIVARTAEVVVGKSATWKICCI